MSAQALLGGRGLGLGISRRGQQHRPRPALQLARPVRGIRLAARAAPPAGKESLSPAAEEALAPIEQDLPFLDPFVRSFLLGLAAGAICEASHVLFKFYGLSMHIDGDVFQALPTYLDQFSPLFLWDHIAAVGSWVLLYAIEAIAILSVLKRYPDDVQTQANALRNMASLPRKMLPVKLSAFKRLLFSLTASRRVNGFLSAAATATAAAATAGVATAAPLQFRDSGSSATLAAPNADIIADIEAKAAAPLPKAPALPQLQRKPATAADMAQREAERKDKLAKARSGKALAPGAWDPTRTLAPPAEAEALQRKSYLRNFWYAAALSSALPKDAPMAVEVLGSKVVLFRDAATGAVLCLDDSCVHRGAPLSGGRVAVDKATGASCIVCPYHGWTFDGQGHLKDVPSAEPGRWPKRPIQSSHPVVEQDGFIWLFFGNSLLPEAERPPVPTAQQLGADASGKWQRPLYGEVEFDVGHWSVFENAIDMSHMRTSLAKAFGTDVANISAPTTTRDTFGVETTYTVCIPAAVPSEEPQTVAVTARAMLPSSLSLTMELGAGKAISALVNTVPVSENKAVNRYSLQRNFPAWNPEHMWAHAALLRLLGDDPSVVGQLTPESLAEEWANGPNAPQVAFRQLRQEWMGLGYGVLPESIKKRRGLVARDM